MPPITIPGGKPVTALPGETPRFPVTTVGPVLVTVLPARTPKLDAVPRLTVTGVAVALAAASAPVTANSMSERINFIATFCGPRAAGV